MMSHTRRWILSVPPTHLIRRRLNFRHHETPAAVENPAADGDGMENPMQTDSQPVHPDPVVAGTDQQCDAGYLAVPNSVLPVSDN